MSTSFIPKELAALFREVLSENTPTVDAIRGQLQSAKDQGNIVDFLEKGDGLFEIQPAVALTDVGVRINLEVPPQPSKPPREAAYPTTTNCPEGGWTVGELIETLSAYPKDAPVHTLAHTDFGAHNNWTVWYFGKDCVYDEQMGDGPQKVPLVLLD